MKKIKINMKHLIIFGIAKKLVLLGIMFIGIHSANAEQKAETKMDASPVQKAIEFAPAPAEKFTGNAYFANRFQSGDLNDYRGVIVRFDPGARTNWHTHPRGQTLVITEGKGLVQIEGESIIKVAPGDTVFFPPNTRHWHGAAPDTAMSHIAIQSPDESGEHVAWEEPVTDNQYNNR